MVAWTSRFVTEDPYPVPATRLDKTPLVVGQLPVVLGILLLEPEQKVGMDEDRVQLHPEPTGMVGEWEYGTQVRGLLRFRGLPIRVAAHVVRGVVLPVTEGHHVVATPEPPAVPQGR